jgi:hypothetical protein
MERIEVVNNVVRYPLGSIVLNSDVTEYEYMLCTATDQFAALIVTRAGVASAVPVTGVLTSKVKNLSYPGFSTKLYSDYRGGGADDFTIYMMYRRRVPVYNILLRYDAMSVVVVDGVVTNFKSDTISFQAATEYERIRIIRITPINVACNDAWINFGAVRFAFYRSGAVYNGYAQYARVSYVSGDVVGTNLPNGTYALHIGFFARKHLGLDRYVKFDGEDAA